MSEKETVEGAIARLGYDPNELVECINTHVPKNEGEGIHNFDLGDHRGVNKRIVVKPGDRFRCELGLTKPRREEKAGKKALPSAIEMLTNGDCVPVASEKAQRYLAKLGKKAAA